MRSLILTLSLAEQLELVKADKLTLESTHQKAITNISLVSGLRTELISPATIHQKVITKFTNSKPAISSNLVGDLIGNR